MFDKIIKPFNNNLWRLCSTHLQAATRRNISNNKNKDTYKYTHTSTVKYVNTSKRLRSIKM